MALVILRCVFLLVAAGVGVSILNSDAMEGASTGFSLGVFAGIMVAALVGVAIDMLLPRKRIDIVSSVYFGTLIGLVLSYAVGLALEPLLHDLKAQQPIKLVVGLLLCYSCISLLMQTKDDFRLIIVAARGTSLK